MEQAFIKLYAYVAQAFRYPSAETLQFLSDPVIAEDVCALAKNILRLDLAPQEMAPTELEYIRVFGHTISAAAPLYELEYGDNQIQAQTYILGEIAGFYQAFNVKLSSAASERVDHISVECEYLSWLSYLESFAQLNKDADRLELCRNAHKNFLKEHLARWGISFCGRVSDVAISGPYAQWARLLKEIILKDCKRFQVSEGKSDLVLRVPELEPSEKCGELT